MRARGKGTGRGAYRLAYDGKLICALLAVSSALSPTGIAARLVRRATQA